MSQRTSKIAVVICTSGRPEIIAETVAFINAGTLVPEEIIVVGVEADNIPDFKADNVRSFLTSQGLTRQRNFGAAQISSDPELIAFVDDDLFVHPVYFENMLQVFQDHPEATLVMGHIIKNGDVSPQEARTLIADKTITQEDRANYTRTDAEWGGVYGANMVIRKSFFETEKFDERLALYGGLEDADMGSRARRHGEVGYYFGAQCVHLRHPGARISYRKLGFSEVMNAMYLARKGTVPWKIAIVRHLLLRPASNMAKAVLQGERDRYERFRGNLIALFTLAQGKLQPEKIEDV